MSDLVLYLGITFVGYIIGSRIRDKKDKLSWTGKVQTVAIIILVLLMGMRMGSNEEITANLSTIGISALLITLVIMGMTVGAIFITRKLLGIDKYGRMQDKNQPAESETAGEHEESGMNMMTIYIVIAVIVGMAFGYFAIRQMFEGNMAAFDEFAGLGIKVGLCMLLIFVGMDLGLDGTVVENFKNVGFRILIFPIVTIIGTLGGGVVVSFFLELSLKECLAIAAGFGWYTLAPGIIMEAGYLTASAVAFLHNVMRELLSIIFIPLIAKKIGFIETTGMPGAAAMDVCLPIVEKSTRSDIAVYSFVSGVILSILVPVLVPLIIG